MNISKIIKEEMDDFKWVGDIKTAIPNRSEVLHKDVTVTIPFQDYLTINYPYNFITIILNDGRVIDITIDGYDIKYSVYGSLLDLVESEELLLGIRDDVTEEDYVSEMRVKPLDDGVSDLLREIIPNNIKSIYVGDL